MSGVPALTPVVYDAKLYVACIADNQAIPLCTQQLRVVDECCYLAILSPWGIGHRYCGYWLIHVKELCGVSRLVNRIVIAHEATLPVYVPHAWSLAFQAHLPKSQPIVGHKELHTLGMYPCLREADTCSCILYIRQCCSSCL